MTLAQWARNRGVPYRTANRWFHRNQLPEGVTARRTPSGSIEVETDPLGEVDIHALVRRLHEHGYVILTRSQAKQLGIKQVLKSGEKTPGCRDDESARKGE